MSPLRLEKKIHDKDVWEEIKDRKAGKVDVQLGKKGLTPGFIREVKARLEKHGVVKIRMLKSYVRSTNSDRREIAKMITKLVGAKLIEVRGYTFIIAGNKDKYRSLKIVGEKEDSRDKKWLQR
ncbi:YhbY family RNA-binding protein [Staphylothermus hellenicus]|uniref:CRM domain-containing protein n=1 Tax=Staphylothermus hellenicus (strain DSM 12710 / JCM 10830 / BK20S6-10-b1 / P8) TaxID=591019 RepID=D7D9N7_STAHD|nr:YhbY family RNA-binding protein [Staphylothermus hellenicus]ADI32483.1 protein of unknown function UPF0044 [Staphylothermus hellenicus DSM 12710]